MRDLVAHIEVCRARNFSLAPVFETVADLPDVICRDERAQLPSGEHAEHQGMSV